MFLLWQCVSRRVCPGAARQGGQLSVAAALHDAPHVADADGSGRALPVDPHLHSRELNARLGAADTNQTEPRAAPLSAQWSRLDCRRSILSDAATIPVFAVDEATACPCDCRFSAFTPRSDSGCWRGRRRWGARSLSGAVGQVRGGGQGRGAGDALAGDLQDLLGAGELRGPARGSQSHLLPQGKSWQMNSMSSFLRSPVIFLHRPF